MKRPKTLKSLSMNIDKSYGPTQTISMGPRKPGGKAINVRGGFVPQSVIKKIASPEGMNIINHIGNGNYGSAFQEAAKMALKEHADKPLGMVVNAVNNFNSARESAGQKPTTHRKRSFETLPNGQTVVSESDRVVQRGLDSLHNAIHKLVCYTGRPTSRSLRRIAKDNGVITSRVFDTRAQNVLSPTITRQQLTNSSGFNLRQFFIPPTKSFITYEDVFNAIGRQPQEFGKADGGITRAYASVLDTTTEFAIFNQSFGQSMNVKVHLVNRLTPRSDELTANSAIDELVNYCLFPNPKIVDPGTVDNYEGMVPAFYQETTVSIDQGTSYPNKSAHWEHSLKGKGLLDSSYFRQAFRIEKTFSKTIKPTDLWLFKHVHMHGGGVDLYKAQMYNKNNPVSPVDIDLLEPVSDYFYIIEAKGAQNVEISYNTSGTVLDSYIGVAPSFYLVDFRKTIRYVKSSDATDLNLDGITVNPGHVRIFWEDPVRTAADAVVTEFRVKSENIAFNEAAVGVGKAFVNSITDQSLTSRLVAGGQGGKDTGV